MPAQTTVASATVYGKGDTAPYRAWRLTDDYNRYINLTDYTVYIKIAHATYSYYLSPRAVIVDWSLCVVDPDQTEEGNRGVVWWRPESGDLDVAGPMMAQFKIVDADDREQTIPTDTYLPFYVRTRVGGDE